MPEVFYVCTSAGTCTGFTHLAKELLKALAVLQGVSEALQPLRQGGTHSLPHGRHQPSTTPQVLARGTRHCGTRRASPSFPLADPAVRISSDPRWLVRSSLAWGKHSQGELAWPPVGVMGRAPLAPPPTRAPIPSRSPRVSWLQLGVHAHMHSLHRLVRVHAGTRPAETERLRLGAIVAA